MKVKWRWSSRSRDKPQERYTLEYTDVLSSQCELLLAVWCVYVWNLHITPGLCYESAGRPSARKLELKWGVTHKGCECNKMIQKSIIRRISREPSIQKINIKKPAQIGFNKQAKTSIYLIGSIMIFRLNSQQSAVDKQAWISSERPITKHVRKQRTCDLPYIVAWPPSARYSNTKPQRATVPPTPHRHNVSGSVYVSTCGYYYIKLFSYLRITFRHWSTMIRISTSHLRVPPTTSLLSTNTVKDVCIWFYI